MYVCMRAFINLCDFYATFFNKASGQLTVKEQKNLENRRVSRELCTIFSVQVHIMSGPNSYPLKFMENSDFHRC